MTEKPEKRWHVISIAGEIRGFGDDECLTGLIATYQDMPGAIITQTPNHMEILHNDSSVSAHLLCTI